MRNVSNLAFRGFAAFFVALLVTTGVSMAQQAGLSYERWVGLAGVTGEVSELTSSSQFLAQPSFSEVITNSEAASNVGENFGARVRGSVTAPLTGDYTFWVAGRMAASFGFLLIAASLIAKKLLL